MHETHLVKDLLGEIERVANQAGAARVVSLDIWLGALCHMDREHFVMHFEPLAEGSVAAQAKLNITVSTDMDHPSAQGVILRNIEVTDD